MLLHICLYNIPIIHYLSKYTILPDTLYAYSFAVLSLLFMLIEHVHQKMVVPQPGLVPPFL